MRHDNDHRANLAILIIAFVGVLAANTGGFLSGLLMTACVLALVLYVVPRRLRERSQARRHEPGIQLLRYLAGTGGPVLRLQNDVIDSYVLSFGGDRTTATRPRRTPKLSDVDRYLDRISRTYDATDAAELAEHVEMMRRTRREHPPLAEEAYERVTTSLSFQDDRPRMRDMRQTDFVDDLMSALPFLRRDTPAPTQSRAVPAIERRDEPPAIPDHSSHVMQALAECEVPQALDLMKRLRPLMRTERLETLDGDLLSEANSACRDLSELADDFLRSRARTRTPALDGDFVRIADGVAGRLEELQQRQGAREADGFSERAKFIAQRHALPTGTPLDGI